MELIGLGLNAQFFLLLALVLFSIFKVRVKKPISKNSFKNLVHVGPDRYSMNVHSCSACLSHLDSSLISPWHFTGKGFIILLKNNLDVSIKNKNRNNI